MASLALGGSAKVSVGEDKWRHEGPEVEEEADPAGNDLDPHGGPLAGYILELCIRAKKTEESQVKELPGAIEPPPRQSQECLQWNLAATTP